MALLDVYAPIRLQRMALYECGWNDWLLALQSACFNQWTF